MLYETRPTTKLYRINGKTIDSQEPIPGVRVITDSPDAVEVIDPTTDTAIVDVIQAQAKGVLMLGEKPLAKRSSFQYKSGDYCHIYLPKQERKPVECPGF
jgi:hypothetical protein